MLFILTTMKKNIFIGILIFLWIPLHSFAQIKWSFDKSDILKSDVSDQKLIFHSKHSSPELVNGIKGVGLRTDGYTTWLTSNFIPNKPIQAISGYFALESFPTESGGLISLRNTDNSESLSICVDRFGTLSIWSS